MPISVETSIPVKNKIAEDRHLKVEPFRKEVRVTKPHKHKQYFEIVYLSGGSGTHWIDGTRYEVRPPVLFFINRDQIHYWELQGDPEGYVIILKNSFLQRSKDAMLNQLIHQVWHTNCLYLDGEQDVNTLFPLLANHAFRFSIYDQQSEEHTSELQSLMRISYAVFCL